MIIQIDLKRNPDVSDLIADMNMGDGVCFYTSLKSRSPALAEFTLEKAEECDLSKMQDDGDGSDTENSADNASENADESESQNTPGGSMMQDKMAAATSAQI